eukprot:1322133-Pyramimonas_sp.AAC.2
MLLGGPTCGWHVGCPPPAVVMGRDGLEELGRVASSAVWPPEARAISRLVQHVLRERKHHNFDAVSRISMRATEHNVYRDYTIAH